MIFDLILNIAGPIAAKRFGFVRKALWLVPILALCAWLLAYAMK